MENVTLDVIVLNLDREAREIIGEGERRKLYEVLKRDAAKTPMGWVILNYNDPELEQLINSINAKVGRPVVAVVKTTVPEPLLRIWLKEYEQELLESLANYMRKKTPTSYVRRKELINVLKRIREILGEEASGEEVLVGVA